VESGTGEKESMSKVTGMRLRSCRLRDGYTQKEVAARTWLEEGTIARLENGGDMAVSTAKSLGELFKVSPAWLLDIEVSADTQVEYQLEIRHNGKWLKAEMPDGTEIPNIWDSKDEAQMMLTKCAIEWEKAHPKLYSRGDYRILARYVGHWMPQLMLFDVFE